MEIISELVYLKCLRLENCSVEELSSSISNLRNLEILDIWRSKVGMFANVLWKLKHLKYLSLPVNLEVVEKLRFKGLDELEVIYHYHSDYCDTYELIGLRKLKVLSGAFYMKRDADLCKSVLNFTKSRELRFSNLSIHCEELCLVSLLECCFTNAFHIYGPICKFPRECKLDLRENAYLGTEMDCAANGFPKLETLSLSGLKGIKQWRVEEGAMPKLSYLVINSCWKLEMLPEGLRYLAALESLFIESMHDTFIQRVKGVDKYKISHVPNLRAHIPQREMGDDCPF